MVKRPRLESTHSNLPEELDWLVVLVDSVWDEVVEVRETVRVAEDCLRSIEGCLCGVEDWVRSMRRGA